MRATQRHFLAVFVVLMASAAPLHASETQRSVAGEEVTLFETGGWNNRPKLVGVRMRLQKGWHTYWRTPGDSGLAPNFDWSASKNVAAVEVLWPVPKRFDAEGDTTFGYEDEIVWPVWVRAIDPDEPIAVDLKMSYGVCKDICVPNEVHLSKTVSPVSYEITAPSLNDKLIRPFLDRVPKAPRPPVTVTAKLTGEELSVTLSSVSEAPALIPEGPRGVWFGKPETTQTSKGVMYKMPVEINKGRALKGSDIVLTFSGPKIAVEAKVKVE